MLIEEIIQSCKNLVQNNVQEPITFRINKEKTYNSLNREKVFLNNVNLYENIIADNGKIITPIFQFCRSFFPESSVEKRGFKLNVGFSFLKEQMVDFFISLFKAFVFESICDQNKMVLDKYDKMKIDWIDGKGNDIVNDKNPSNLTAVALLTAIKKLQKKGFSEKDLVFYITPNGKNSLLADLKLFSIDIPEILNMPIIIDSAIPIHEEDDTLFKKIKRFFTGKEKSKVAHSILFVKNQVGLITDENLIMSMQRINTEIVSVTGSHYLDAVANDNTVKISHL